MLAVAASAGAAQAVTIDFDDLDAPGPGTAGLTVNAQYNGQGVSFNNLSAFDYEDGPNAIPGFAHSDGVAVETCVAVEFCTSPVRAEFTSGQRTVGAWVGFSGGLGAPTDVRLTALDASSAVVGADDATLPANTSPSPIETHLEVDAGAPVIRRLEVMVTSGGGFANGLAVDDVEFTSVGPPPPCGATSPPRITLVNPGPGISVQNNEFLLEGSVDSPGAPITSATVSARSGSGTTRTSSIFPQLIGAGGDGVGPVRVNGLLFAPAPDTQEIVVSATNCRGTGSSDARSISWSALPPTTRFRQVGPIEVTQSVQTPLNTVPLIAANPNGIKRTFARVPLEVLGGPARVTGVTGTLTASLPDGSPAPGPLRIGSVNPAPALATIGSNPAAEQRTRLDDPLMFELPRNGWRPGGCTCSSSTPSSTGWSRASHARAATTRRSRGYPGSWDRRS